MPVYCTLVQIVLKGFDRLVPNEASSHQQLKVLAIRFCSPRKVWYANEVAVQWLPPELALR